MTKRKQELQAHQRVLTEDVLSLTEARAELEPLIGRRIQKCTLTRWCHRGVGGVRLDHARIGSSIITSRQALTRFIDARSAIA